MSGSFLLLENPVWALGLSPLPSRPSCLPGPGADKNDKDSHVCGIPTTWTVDPQGNTELRHSRKAMGRIYHQKTFLPFSSVRHKSLVESVWQASRRKLRVRPHRARHCEIAAPGARRRRVGPFPQRRAGGLPSNPSDILRIRSGTGCWRQWSCNAYKLRGPPGFQMTQDRDFCLRSNKHLIR